MLSFLFIHLVILVGERLLRFHEQTRGMSMEKYFISYTFYHLYPIITQALHMCLTADLQQAESHFLSVLCGNFSRSKHSQIKTRLSAKQVCRLTVQIPPNWLRGNSAGTQTDFPTGSSGPGKSCPRPAIRLCLSGFLSPSDTEILAHARREAFPFIWKSAQNLRDLNFWKDQAVRKEKCFNSIDVVYQIVINQYQLKK